MTQIPSPPQYPPMQPPPPGMPGQGYGVPAPKKGNGPAIASLVCGILGCVPFLTGLLAIILGIVGIRKTRDPQVGGKGLAIAGLILGILSIGGWGLFGGGALALFAGTSAQREVARQFIKDLDAGNVDAAMAQTDGSIAKEDIEKLAAQMKAWGPVTDTTVVGISAEPGKTQVTGAVTFGTTAKAFEAIVLKMPDGSYKVAGLHFK